MKKHSSIGKSSEKVRIKTMTGTQDFGAMELLIKLGGHLTVTNSVILKK